MGKTSKHDSKVYGDGGNLTHYLGNDDYSGNKETDILSEEERQVDGREAQGNELTDQDSESSVSESSSSNDRPIDGQ